MQFTLSVLVFPENVNLLPISHVPLWFCFDLLFTSCAVEGLKERYLFKSGTMGRRPWNKSFKKTGKENATAISFPANGTCTQSFTCTFVFSVTVVLDNTRPALSKLFEDFGFFFDVNHAVTIASSPCLSNKGGHNEQKLQNKMLAETYCFYPPKFVFLRDLEAQ